MKQGMRIAGIIFVSLLGWQTATAGEFKCTFGCQLDGMFPDIKWEPTSCYKPRPPLLIVISPRDFNNAVREFNNWLLQVDSYNSCVQNEAIADLKKMPDIFKKGISEARDDIDREVQRTRSQLEIQRP